MASIITGFVIRRKRMDEQQLYNIIGKLYCKLLIQEESYNQLLNQANSLAQQLASRNQEKDGSDGKTKAPVSL